MTTDVKPLARELFQAVQTQVDGASNDTIERIAKAAEAVYAESQNSATYWFKRFAEELRRTQDS